MLQHGWRAYHGQLAKKGAKGGRLVDESGVPENSILNEPLFYKSALQYAQMRAESVNGMPHARPLPCTLFEPELKPRARMCRVGSVCCVCVSGVGFGEEQVEDCLS
jgi:hypothetical protein